MLKENLNIYARKAKSRDPGRTVGGDINRSSEQEIETVQFRPFM